jgi:hypothetical protein
VAVLEELAVAELVKEFIEFHENRRLITDFIES